jgi:hypothetical protein
VVDGQRGPRSVSAERIGDLIGLRHASTAGRADHPRYDKARRNDHTPQAPGCPGLFRHGFRLRHASINQIPALQAHDIISQRFIGLPIVFPLDILFLCDPDKLKQNIDQYNWLSSACEFLL